MRPHGPSSYDLRWRRRELPGLLLLCVMASGVVALRSCRPRRRVGMAIDVIPDRVESARQKINPNTASGASLQRLPGIGPTRANGIIEYRRQHWDRPFRSAADLEAVEGIGPGTVERIKPYLDFGGDGGR